MPGEYLLDTSFIIPLFRGEPNVQKRLEQAERVFLSAVVLGELLARPPAEIETRLVYDGRGFLVHAEEGPLDGLFADGFESGDPGSAIAIEPPSTPSSSTTSATSSGRRRSNARRAASP